MKTVLIYVLSAEMGPYPELREASAGTWDVEQVPWTETLYYSASSVPSAGVMVNIPIADGLYEMGRKDLAAFEWALKNSAFDYMARVNASCYTRKRKVSKLVQDLPDTGVFRGLCGPGPGGRYMWGGGQFIISRDVVAAMVFNAAKWDHTQMEDVAMTRLVQQMGYRLDCEGDAASINRDKDHWLCFRYVDGGMRNFEFTDFSEVKAKIEDCPFIRVKQDGDRKKDIWIMQELYRHGV